MGPSLLQSFDDLGIVFTTGYFQALAGQPIRNIPKLWLGERK